MNSLNQLGREYSFYAYVEDINDDNEFMEL